MNLYESFPETVTRRPAEEAELPHVDLVMANMREALLYTRECCRRKIPDDALVSLCYETMLKSAPLFKAKWGTRFFAYSKARLRGALKRYWSSLSVVRNAQTVSVDMMRSIETDTGDRIGVSEVPDIETSHLGTTEPDFESIFLNDSWRAVADIMARKCTDLERTIIFFAYKHQLSFEEIGDLLDLSRQFVSVTAKKGLQKIQRGLGKI